MNDPAEGLLRRYNWPPMVKRTIQEFHGIAGAVVYDKKISDDEIEMLKDYLARCVDYLDQWPMDEFSRLFRGVISKKPITDEVRLALLVFLEKVATGVDHDRPIISGIFDENPIIKFRNKSFMFTGKLQFGSRKKAENEVMIRGGAVVGNGFMDLDYLVVGIEGNESWKYGRYGSKIEKVMKLKTENRITTSIVTEYDFIKALT